MKRYAVFVGINSYTNDITPLSCACQDAKELSMEFAASGFERPVLLLDSDVGSGRELNNEHYLVCPEGYAQADLFSPASRNHLKAFSGSSAGQMPNCRRKRQCRSSIQAG